MSDDDFDLPRGLYERLVTTALRARLDTADPNLVDIRVRPVAAEEAAETLARHVSIVVARALGELPEQDRAERQVAVTNRIVELLADDEEAVALPASELRSVQPRTGDPALDRETVAPIVPLSAADLLVNARGEPALAHALAHEIPSADSVDLLCAFIRWHGLRVLVDPLVGALPRGQAPARHHDGLHGLHRAQGAGLAARPRRPGQGELRHTSPRACTPRRGCSARSPATPPRTSARRTCRSRRCSTAWSGTCGCRRWVRRTCSRSSTPRSTATGPARSTRTTREPPTQMTRFDRAVVRHRRGHAGRAAHLPRGGAVAAPARDPGEAGRRAQAPQPLEEPGGGRHRHRQDHRRGAGLQAPAQRDARSAPTRACCSWRTARRS